MHWLGVSSSEGSVLMSDYGLVYKPSYEHRFSFIPDFDVVG